MSTNQKFNDAKERLVITAQRVAGNYLLAKYGSAHLVNEPVVELTYTQDEKSTAYRFSGKITCYASDGLLNQVGVNMTINENDIEVTSEDVQSNVTNALVSAEENQDVLVASLDGFRLKDDGSNYLKVSHVAAHEADLGIVGKDEWKGSKNKSALLQGILKDAAISPKVEFTGEFTEPTIEKTAGPKHDPDANDKCLECGKEQGDTSGVCEFCGGATARDCAHCRASLKAPVKKEAAQESKPQPRSTWLTAELLKDAAEDAIDETFECSKCGQNEREGLATTVEGKKYCEECATAMGKFATISIEENMPRAKAADHLIQTAQAEEQSALEAQLKVEHEAANELVNLLHGMGYGTAKAVEITSSKEGFDVMTAVDHNGAIKAVSIPVTVKEGKYALPKKGLIATLIEKGLDVQAKLAEQFDLETLEKLAAIDDRMAWEANEFNAILNEKSVEKTANEGKNTMFEGDTDTLTVQKHLIPNHESLKVGDKVSDGSDQWEIVNQGGQQNSKGEGDSSLWTMKKCQAPARSDDEPKNKIPL